ncbi:MAG: tail fiber domain-containing protein [Candidatus Omnitrophica bacterium]|nr:tail fiber domain-containing protein [Candidatus Omnitrophota bacterium]MDD5771193.1 tail fiber domain-containing protein [Candidatus Omnitrophota bacterium]
MLRLTRNFLLVSFILSVFAPVVFAQEEITITTYYPSPYGSYNALTTYKLGVGDNDGDGNLTSADVPTDNGNAWIAGKLGVGNTDFLDGPGALTYHMYIGNNGGGLRRVRINSGTSGKFIYLVSAGSSGWMYSVGDSNPLHVSTLGNSDIEFYRSGVLAMSIGSGNRLGIGLSSPSYQLQLSSDSAAKPSSNTWSIASDKRIKKNISDFTDGINVVMKLKPHTYQYNGLGGKGYDDTDTHIGFVAQEVELVAPYMVETKQGMIGGEQVDDFKSYQGHALPFILVNAIQEQQGVIKAQQLEIDDLKARMDKLEGKESAPKNDLEAAEK